MNPHVQRMLTRNKKNPELYEMRVGIMRYTEKYGVFITDEVRQYMENTGHIFKSPRLFGPAITSLHRDKYIHFVDWATATNPKSHGAPTRKWIWSGKQFDYESEMKNFSEQYKNLEQQLLF